MKLQLVTILFLLSLFCSCSDKTYTDKLNQSDWLSLYENISLTENNAVIKKKFPTITDWATQEKDNKVYIWTSQKIYDTDASVAFIFKDNILYQVKIYLIGLSDDAAKDVFDSIKEKYSDDISSSKQFCNNLGTNTEACFWLLESMTVYLKKLDDDKSKILFGFQNR